MKFHSTTLPGVWLIELEPRADDRGFFARTYCEQEFASHGLATHWPQCNVTRTLRRGTIRGLHYQADPHPEIKLVRCTAGKIWDVVVELATGKWEAFELAGDSLRQLYVPAGYAHGFQALTDNCEIFYQMSAPYFPDLARGVRYNDPALAIPWPVPNPQVSDRDQTLPFLHRP